jgi:hypothetical protein
MTSFINMLILNSNASARLPTLKVDTTTQIPIYYYLAIETTVKATSTTSSRIIHLYATVGSIKYDAPVPGYLNANTNNNLQYKNTLGRN